MEAVRGARCADIGSGSGRIVNMLLDAGAAHVTGVEPSQAFAVAQHNIAARAERARILHLRGDELPTDDPLDLVLSLA